MTSTGPTRDEFLDHIHEPLVNPDGDPPKGSPTKSTTRCRWKTLHHWDVEADATAYWEDLPADDKTARLQVNSAYWDVAHQELSSDVEYRTSEITLREPFNLAYRSPHNRAIEGASDVHAKILSEGSRLQSSPIGNPDFLFVHDGKLTGAIELKTWWKVTEDEIEEVRAGKSLRFDVRLMEGRERLDGDHHGRLGIEQLYGYMVFDKILYGILTTFNSFVFLKRRSPGILFMSRMIPNTATRPTVLKLLYYISHLCAQDTNPHPELDFEGNAVRLRKAPKTTQKAPQIPGSDDAEISDNTLPTVTFPGAPRRSPRFQQDTLAFPDDESLDEDSLHLDNLTSLGCKGWRGKINGLTIFAKLWDGWKSPLQGCEHEVSVYYRLQDLWGNIVPKFLGWGEWGYCHILLLSYLECPMLYQAKVTPKIKRNVLKAFKEIHSRGVYHGDVRSENILVRPNHSVVIIDFERSEVDVDLVSLNEEMLEVKHLLASFK